MVSHWLVNIIVHTDRGGQYCSTDYQGLLKRHNLQGSMSARGCCYDNACAERFFHSLKVECIHGERFISRKIMRTTVFNDIGCDDNRWCHHSACGGLSPEQFENQNLAQDGVHITWARLNHEAGNKFIPYAKKASWLSEKMPLKHHGLKIPLTAIATVTESP